MKHGKGDSYIKTIWNSMFNRVGEEEKRIGKAVLLYIYLRLLPAVHFSIVENCTSNMFLRKNMNDQFGAKYCK